MLRRIFPRQFDFFSLFLEASDALLEAAKVSHEMFSSPQNAAKYCQTLDEIESRADEVAHRTLTLLHRTFITPLDRDHIQHLVRLLDDITDLLEAAGQRVNMYAITSFPAGFRELTALNIECATAVRRALELLPSMKNAPQLLTIGVELNKLENHADRIFRATLSTIFREHEDVKLIIQLKEIVELLELVSDRCEDVAHLVETIVLEYA